MTRHEPLPKTLAAAVVFKKLGISNKRVDTWRLSQRDALTSRSHTNPENVLGGGDGDPSAREQERGLRWSFLGTTLYHRGG